MAKFYFGLRIADTLSPDTEGVDFANADEAYLEAFRAARDMWHDLLVRRCDPRVFSFEITDGDGTVLMVVPFSEVLDSCSGRAPRALHRLNASQMRLWLNAQVNAERMGQQTRDLMVQLKSARAEIATSKRLLTEAERFLQQGALVR